jgi:hypothetical protein
MSEPSPEEFELMRRNMQGIIAGFERQRKDDDDRQNDIKALQRTVAMQANDIVTLTKRINQLQYGQVLGSTA